VQTTIDRQVLELIGDVQALIHLPELRNGLMDALARAVPSDWASLNDIGDDPSQTVVLNRPPLDQRWHDAFAQHAHQNPLLARWRETRDGRAYRFSDVASVDELATLDLFQRVYTPLGVRHQIAFTLPSASDRVLAIALSRRGRDFTDHERDLLNQARPFLIQAYRNALEIQRLVGSEVGASGLLQAEGLTPRQSDILLRTAHGASNRDIAGALQISDRTVQKHLQLAYRHLGVRTRSQAADRVWALTRGRT